MFVLDTNVVSESMRKRPHPSVLHWLDNRLKRDLFVTAVTQAGVLTGIAILPAGKRRQGLAAAADRAFDRLTTDEAVVPRLWWFEIRNVLIVNERRGRVTAADTTAFLRDLARLPIRLDANPGEHLVLALARKHGLAVYDAAYLELAVRLDAPVASLDRALNAAARSEGVGIV